MRNNFLGEPFSVSLISGIETVWIRGGGGTSGFSVYYFLSHSADNFVGESFTVALISGIGKVRMREGVVSRNSVENLLSHSVEQIRW